MNTMKILIIINDAPYGSEKAYNALRLAMALQKEESNEVRVFLMGDAVTCALPNQSTPQGYYNVERMLKAVANKKGQIKLCTTCLEARGLKALNLVEGVEIGTTIELAQWVVEMDKVLTF
jgi:uncharacterized protein involved in oxidation of intracellular sulfur